MAIINIYEDSISDLSEKKEVKKGTKLKDFFQDYINKIDNKQIVEVYDPETDTTQFIELVTEDYGCICIADGKEVDLEFVCEEKSVVEVMFFPKSSWSTGEKVGAGITAVGAITMLTFGILAAIATGPGGLGLAMTLGSMGGWQTWFGVGAVIGIAGALIWGGSYLDRTLGNGSTSLSAGETESLHSVTGTSNESILGKTYPIIFGKHLVTPYLIASPYHITMNYAVASSLAKVVNIFKSTSWSYYSYPKDANLKYDHEDIAQYWQAVYCLGYAPLKLTKFKFGETYLAYNEYNEANGTDKTLIHGILTGDDICTKWKNNDVSIEILQAGDLIKATKSKWGTIYPVAVKEQSIEGGSLLYVYDKSLADSDPSKTTNEYTSYNSVALRLGYRTNTVRFSSSCPYRLEVEVDMPSGFYMTRTVSGTNSSKVQYAQPHLYIAVQWRYANNSNASSDAESPSGWNSFEYEIMYDSNGNEVRRKPVTYTENRRKIEISDNLGLSDDTKVEQNASWVGSSVFALDADESQAESGDDYDWEDCSDSDISSLISDGLLSYYQYSLTPFEKPAYFTGDTTSSAKKSSYDVYYQTTKTKKGGGIEYVYKKESGISIQCYKSLSDDVQVIETTGQGYFYSAKGLSGGNWDSGYTYLEYVKSVKVQKKRYRTVYDSDFVTKEKYNLNERRYVFVKNFTVDECKKMVSSEKYKTDNYDTVEVRVIRITPCYLNQSSSDSDDYSAMQYQDIAKWTYLRTWSFNKQEFADEMDNGTLGTEIDCPDRPIPEEDLNRFCYAVVRLKQDASETGGSTLEKFNCIAEALLPKYDLDKRLWSPVYDSVAGKYKDFEIEDLYKYYYTDFDSTEKKRINELPLPFINESTSILDNRNVTLGFVKMTESKSFDSDTTYFYYDSTNDYYVRTSITEDQWIEDSYYYMEDYLSTAYQQYEKGISLPEYSSMFSKHKNGTTYLSDIRDEILNNETTTVLSGVNTYPASISNLQSIAPTKAYLTDELAHRYITQNAASSTIYSLIGSHLKSDAKDLSQIDMTKFADFFEFCNDVTDGSEETYATPMTSSDLPEGFYSTFTTAFTSKKGTTESIRLLAILKKAPVNAVWKGCYDCYIENLLEEVFSDTTLTHYKFDYMNTAKVYLETNSYFAAADGKLHIQYNCNGVVTSETKLEDLFYKLLVTGRAYYRRSDDNKYEPVIGRPNPYPVTVLNQRSVVSKSNSRSYEESISGYQVSMVDENDNYETNTIYAMDDGEDYRNPTKRVEDFQIPFVTNPYQMKSLARFNLACKLYQKETYTRTITALGYSLGIGDTVLLQDDSLLIGTDKGGRIKEIIEDDDYIYGFITDDLFNYTGEIEDDDKELEPLNQRCKQGATVVQASKYGQSRCATVRFANPSQSVIVNEITYQMTVGLTNLCLFFDKINKATEFSEGMKIEGEIYAYKPQVDDLVAFGNINSITTKATVMSVKPKENNQFEVTLVPYNEKLYSFGERFPFFKSNMTTPNRVETDFNFLPYQTTSDAAENVAESATKTITVISEGGEDSYPDDVLSLSVVIDNSQYIQFIPSINTNITNNSIETFNYEINRGDDVWTSISTVNNQYYFDRSVDGYPEVDDWTDSDGVTHIGLKSWNFRVKAVNKYGKVSENWTLAKE